MASDQSNRAQADPGGGEAAPAATPPAGASESSDELTIKNSPADMKTIQQGQKTAQQRQNTIQQGEKTIQQGQKTLQEGEKTIQQGQKTLQEGEKTIQQGRNTVKAGPKTLPQSRPGATQSLSSAALNQLSSQAIGSEMGPATLAPGLTLQDLSTERLLLSAPRTESHGCMCPTLNGIPLLARLGQGGMGAVYYGIHPRLRNEVAVKVMSFQLAEQDPGMIRRFFREAQLAAAVHSPHIVNVMDVSEDSGLFFLVMEYVSGESAGHYLKSVLQKGAPGLSELGALDLTIAATEGLWAAHAQNVIHRDIKPDNIMIPYQSRTAKELDLTRAKLTDLGLARNEDSQQSLTGNQSAMGTPGYMAPEQTMDAKSADKRSDVFSMGATLYALLSGKPPFGGETVMKTLMATMSEVQVPIIKLRQDVSQATNEVVEKCLAKKQENRYSDALKLLGALQDCRRLLTVSGAPEASQAGVRTLVYPNTTPTAQTGSGDSSVEKTALTPGVDPAPAPAPAGKKGLLYIGAAAVAVIALAVGWLLFGGKPGSGTPGGGGTSQNNNPTRLEPSPDQPVDALTVKRHTTLTKEALENAKKGDKEEAEFRLGLAKDLKVPGAEARKREKEAEDRIAALGNKEKFDERFKEVGRLEQRGELEKAAKLLNEAILLLEPDDPAFKTANDKVDEIGKKLNTAKKRKNAEKELAEARESGKEKPEHALDRVTKILGDYADPEDELNQEAKKLKSLLEVAVKENQNKHDYNKKILEVAAAFEARNYEEANKKALEAQTLMPNGKEAAEWLAKIGTMLDDQTKKAAAEQSRKDREQKFAAALKTAVEQEGKGQLDEALAAVLSALKLAPQDEGAATIQKRIVAALEERRKKEEQQKREKDFDTALKQAAIAESLPDLDEAAKKLLEARKLFPGDKDREAQVVAVETQLADRREVLKAKPAYEELLAKVRDARKADKLKEAQEFVDQALQSKAKDSRAEDLKKRIVEALAAGDEYKRIFDEAEAMLQAADKVDLSTAAAYDDKISQINKALDKYAAAKAKKDEGPATARAVEVTQKLDKVKADKAEFLRKQAAAAAAAAATEKKAEEEKKAIAAADAAYGKVKSVLDGLSPTSDQGAFVAAQGEVAKYKEKYKEAPALDELLNQKKLAAFDAQIVLAETAKKKGEYQAADGYLNAATAILADKTALETVEKKRQEYKALMAGNAGNAAKTAFGLVLDALKRNPEDLDAALKPVRDFNKAHPGQRDLETVLGPLEKLQSAAAAIQPVLAGANGKIAEFKGFFVRVAPRPGDEDVEASEKNASVAKAEPKLKALESARDSLQGLVAKEAGQLVTSAFKEADTVLANLDKEQRRLVGEIETLTTQLDGLKGAPKKQTKQQPPKPEKRQKRPGEVDVDDN